MEVVIRRRLKCEELDAFGRDLGSSSLGSMAESVSDSERERLRSVLGFPASVEGVAPPQRHGGRRSLIEQQAPKPTTRAEAAVDDDVGRRLQQLTERVDALAGLVETSFDRLESSVAASSSLTDDDLADSQGLLEVRVEIGDVRKQVRQLQASVDRLTELLLGSN